ncbi:MAG: TauD/TfdA family dioxygenase [Cocleimonas sp.]
MVTVNKTSLSLSLNGIDTSEFNLVWLRDNCQCTECLHPSTNERTLITSEIPDNIAPIASLAAKGNLSIMWNDKQHQSNYSFDWLSENSQADISAKDDPAKGEMQLWDKSLEDKIPTFNYKDLREDNDVLLAWCEAIRDIGLAIVRGAPTEEREIERFADHVACVRETIYDRLHNVRATPGAYNAYNVASTSLELKPHTDMPNYNNPPGVQMFHFLVNEAKGGMSTAVDGFNIAHQLKKQDPAAYKTLTEIQVPFRMYSSRGDIMSENPLLTLDTSGNLKVFRFSNQLTQTLNIPADKMDDFYHAYRLLGKLIEDPSNMVKFRLNTSDMMATNNLRVMHGRTSYDVNSGDRHLQLSYMDYDDVLSRIRMIKKAR